LSSTEEALHATEQNLKGREGEVKLLGGKLRSAEATLVDMDRLLESRLEEKHGLENRLSSLAKKRETEHREHDVQLNMLYETIAGLENQVREAIGAQRNSEGRLQQSEAELKQQDIELDRFHAKVADQERRLKEVTEALRSCDAKLSKRNEELAAAKGNLNEVLGNYAQSLEKPGSLEAVERERDAERSRRVFAMKQLDTAVAGNERLQNELQAAKDALEVRDREVKELEMQLLVKRQERNPSLDSSRERDGDTKFLKSKVRFVGDSLYVAEAKEHSPTLHAHHAQLNEQTQETSSRRSRRSNARA